MNIKRITKVLTSSVPVDGIIAMVELDGKTHRICYWENNEFMRPGIDSGKFVELCTLLDSEEQDWDNTQFLSYRQVTDGRKVKSVELQSIIGQLSLLYENRQSFALTN